MGDRMICPDCGSSSYLVVDHRGRLAWLRRLLGKVTSAQQAWVDALTAVAAASGKALSVHVWRPSDEAEVREVLGR